MWFVFPQIAGLGQSWTSQHYAIASLDEARAYLAHPVLGPRLHECARWCWRRPPLGGGHLRRRRRAEAPVSMTLFHRAAPDEAVFRQVLDRFWAGVADARTDALLGG